MTTLTAAKNRAPVSAGSEARFTPQPYPIGPDRFESQMANHRAFPDQVQVM